jgi:hypothetical protein
MLPGVVLAVLVAAGVLAGRTGRAGAAVLAGAALVWLLVNKPMEGRTLIVFSEYHGLTAADLAGLTAIVLAVVLFVVPHRD